MSMYIDHEHIPFVIEALQGTWKFLNEAPSSVADTQIDSAEAPEEINDVEDQAITA